MLYSADTASCCVIVIWWIAFSVQTLGPARNGASMSYGHSMTGTETFQSHVRSRVNVFIYCDWSCFAALMQDSTVSLHPYLHPFNPISHPLSSTPDQRCLQCLPQGHLARCPLLHPTKVSEPSPSMASIMLHGVVASEFLLSISGRCLLPVKT